jgi:hypothetical protein
VHDGQGSLPVTLLVLLCCLSIAYLIEGFREACLPLMARVIAPVLGIYLSLDFPPCRAENPATLKKNTDPPKAEKALTACVLMNIPKERAIN